jgi:hypothetical protein
MPLAAGVLHRHGQDRSHITGDGGFRHPKGTRQPGSDAVPEALTPEMLGDLLAAQTGVEVAETVILAPSIHALTDLCPTGICTPDVWHFSQSFCVSDILMRDASPTR